MRATIARSVFLLAFGAAALAQGPAALSEKTTSSLVERVGDTAFIQVQADSFNQLDARHKELAYWLTQASIAIDPIIYDQLSQYGLREKRVLEEILAHQSGIAPDALAKIRSFALLFWANRGNHNEQTAQKFLPTFTAAELEQAVLKAQAGGGFTSPYGDLPALATPADLRRELAALNTSLFDANVEPTATAKTPPPGKD